MKEDKRKEYFYFSDLKGLERFSDVEHNRTLFSNDTRLRTRFFWLIKRRLQDVLEVFEVWQLKEFNHGLINFTLSIARN